MFDVIFKLVASYDLINFTRIAECKKYLRITIDIFITDSDAYFVSMSSIHVGQKLVVEILRQFFPKQHLF